MTNGRRTKLTPKTQQMIVDALSVGTTIKLACDYAGIHPDTYYYWLTRARDGEQPYADFAEAIQQTQGRAVVGWLEKIEAAANEGNWQAAAWKLERRYPEDYGRRIQEHTGNLAHTVQLIQVTLE